MTEIIHEEKVIKTINPLVFISHDTRDAKLAEAFSSLLKSVSMGILKSFRSSDRKGKQGIEYGLEWYPEIIKNIQNASDVVCLLTQNSIDRPWILFEAGMAKGKRDTAILGVALGISLTDVITGPFAQFQNCDDDEDSLVKLVSQLVDKIPNSEPDDEAIKYHVRNFKEQIEVIFKTTATPATKIVEEANEDASAKLFEEIKMMFKDLPSRIGDNMKIGSREKNIHRVHPKIIDRFCWRDDCGIDGLIIALSLFKNSSMPWFYDVGVEAIRNIQKTESEAEKNRLFRNFAKTIEHPAIRDFAIDYNDDYHYSREAIDVILTNMHRLLIGSL